MEISYYIFIGVIVLTTIVLKKRELQYEYIKKNLS